MDVLIKNHPSADKGIDMTTPPLPPPFIRYGTTPTGCGCPASIYRPRERCKHVRRLRDALETLREYHAAQASRSPGMAYQHAVGRL